jgi:hypothetical protein
MPDGLRGFVQGGSAAGRWPTRNDKRFDDPSRGEKALDQRADGAHPAAETRWQPPYRDLVDAAQRRDRQPRCTRQPRPTRRPETNGVRVARRRECRGQERDLRPRPPGTPQFRRSMRRTCQHASPCSCMPGPASATQMRAGPERCRQTDVACHHQGEPSGPADACQCPPEFRAVRVAVVAQHDASKATRQPRDRRAWVGQSPFIGEQPQYGESASAARTPRLDCARPSDKPYVHGTPYPIRRNQYR